MKKIIWFLLLAFSFSFTFGSECTDFYYGKICISIENQWNGNYKLVRQLTNQKPVEDNLYIINCEMLLPNWKLKDMWVCNTTFQYDLTWTGKVKFYVNFQWENSVISYNYNFQKYYIWYWLTTKQTKELQDIYKLWPKLIDKLKTKYPKLSNNSSWKNKSNEIYAITKELIDWKWSKTITYSDYEKIIKDYVKYTINIVK